MPRQFKQVDRSPEHQFRAVSSAVEHCLHTAGVAGSNPAPPTKKIKHLAERLGAFFLPVSKFGTILGQWGSSQAWHSTTT